MTRFIETDGGQYIPLNRIARYYKWRREEKIKGGSYFCRGCTVIDIDGDRHEVAPNAVEIAEKTSRSLIPALPEFYLVWPPEKESDEIVRTPIIAWTFNMFGGLHPMTADTDACDEDYIEWNRLVIQYPDGSICDPSIQTWADYKSYARDMVVDAKTRQARQAEKERREFAKELEGKAA